MLKVIKQNDTKPYLATVLQEVTTDPLKTTAKNLTSGTVKFIMKSVSDGTVKVDATLAGSELVDETNGIVQYEWVAADTDTCGDYYGEFQVTDSEAAVTTYWDTRTAQEIEDELPAKPLTIRIIDDFA